MMNFNEIRVVAIVLALMSIFTILCFVVGCSGNAIPEPVAYKSYVVKEGDSLWKIATMSNGYNQMDTRYIVDHIEEKSNATSIIYPGQVVFIPVYEIVD